MREQKSIGRLLAHLHRQGSIYLQRHLSTWGVGSGSHRLILMLFHGEGVSQRELARELHLDKAAVARMIKKLSQAGYIRKEVDPEDRRASKIHLTEDGRELVPQIRKVLNGWSNVLTGGFSPREQEEVLGLLERMSINAAGFIEKKNKNTSSSPAE